MTTPLIGFLSASFLCATAAQAPPTIFLQQTQTGEDVAYTLVSCTGSRKAQTVTVKFLVKNSGPTRDLQFAKLTAVDPAGTGYQTYDVGFGTTPRSSVATGINVKAAGVIKGILPSVKSFAIITLASYKKNSGPGKDVEMEYRDVPITWQ